MKALFAVILIAESMSVAPHTSVRAGDLAARCSANWRVCGHAIDWVADNLGGCTEARLTDAQIVDKIVDWLKKHPETTARNDNFLVARAVATLWPCHL